MLMIRYRQLLTAALFFAASQAAFSQNVSLTDKQFQNRGAVEFVGTIMSVQISTSTRYAESGTVQIQVNHVIAGTLAVPTVTFAFQRSLAPTDFLSNWDLVAPFGTSLEAAVGNKLLMFVTDESGKYSIYPASNSVQAINQGLLVGTVVSVPKHGEDPEPDRDDAIEVKVQVDEAVYGWVKGTTVTLLLPKHLPSGGGGDAHGPQGNGPTALVSKFFSGEYPISAGNAGLAYDPSSGDNNGKQFVVAFVNGQISAIEVASVEFLNTLQTLDSQ